MTQSRTAQAAAHSTLATLLAVSMLAWATALPADEPLGRLFLTPDQRLALEANRAPDALAGDGTPGSPASDAPATAGPIFLNGILRRDDGSSVIWMNGRRTGPEPHGAVQVRNSHELLIMHAPDGSAVRLKPGQAWDPATGRIAGCPGCLSEAGHPDATADGPAKVP